MMNAECGMRNTERAQRGSHGCRHSLTSELRPLSSVRSAFTLVELMAVVALIGLMMLVAMPSLSSGRSSALIGAARQLSNDLNLARQYAIAHNYHTRVVIATEKTIDDSQTTLPDLMAMQYSAYAIMQQARVGSGGIAWFSRAPNNQPNLPQGRYEWTYTQAWKFLPKGVIFDPADQTLKSVDGKSTSLRGTSLFRGQMASRDLWEGVTLDKLPFPYRNSESDPPRGCEMAFIEFKSNGVPTMSGSVRLINGIVQVGRTGSGGGSSVTLIVPGRQTPTSTSGGSDPASLNCVVLSWDNLGGKIKWTQPGR